MCTHKALKGMQNTIWSKWKNEVNEMNKKPTKRNYLIKRNKLNKRNNRITQNKLNEEIEQSKKLLQRARTRVWKGIKYTVCNKWKKWVLTPGRLSNADLKVILWPCICCWNKRTNRNKLKQIRQIKLKVAVVCTHKGCKEWKIQFGANERNEINENNWTKNKQKEITELKKIIINETTESNKINEWSKFNKVKIAAECDHKGLKGDEIHKL